MWFSVAILLRKKFIIIVRNKMKKNWCMSLMQTARSTDACIPNIRFDDIACCSHCFRQRIIIREKMLMFSFLCLSATIHLNSAIQFSKVTLNISCMKTLWVISTNDWSYVLRNYEHSTQTDSWILYIYSNEYVIEIDAIRNIQTLISLLHMCTTWRDLFLNMILHSLIAGRKNSSTSTP